MKIVIFAAGSRGDIQPCIVLAEGLEKSGYTVQIAAPENYGPFIKECNIDFYALPGDIGILINSDTGREFLGKKGRNPLSSIRAMGRLISPIAKGMVEGVSDACYSADVLICLSIFHPFGRSIAEKTGTLLLDFEPAPLLPTGDFPAPSWPSGRSFGRIYNYLTGIVMMYVIWLWFAPFVSELRQTWELTPLSFLRNMRSMRSTPALCAFSDLICPRPSDWPKESHLIGPLFLKNREAWSPSSELEEFLFSGSAPVYIGFGSMETNEPEILFRIILEALEKTGMRGIIVSKWDVAGPEAASGRILLLDEAPHGWLFPKMAVLVHHGGAGTTAEGLRSGIPSVVVPFAFDQYFWGKRLERMGLGPEPIPVKKLSSDRLAEAIEIAMADKKMREKVRSVGEKIAAEDGVVRAVSVIDGIISRFKSGELKNED